LPEQATTITVTSSTDPSYSGQAVTFVAKVSPTDATGTVTFMEEHNSLGTATLASGQAALTISSLPAGSLPITAVYGGDSKFAGGTASVLTQTVNQATTAISVKSAPNPSAVGQVVTFTAVVTLTSSTVGSPTGTVSFNAGNTVIGTGTLDATGTATFSTSTLHAGKYDVKAVYSGSPAFEGNSSTVITQVVQ
jgi:hypothetical protein